MYENNRIWVLASLAMLATGVSGCSRCSGDDILAELSEARGSVQRDWASEQEKWQPAELGTTFQLGDGVRTAKSSEAILKLHGGSYVRMTPESVIRFLETIPSGKHKGAQGIDVQSGEAELVVGNSELVLYTSVGMATLQSGSRLNIKATKNGLEFKVEIGQATFYDKNDNPTVVKRDEQITISIGAAILARGEKEQATETEEAAAPTEEAPPTDSTSDEEAVEEKGGKASAGPRRGEIEIGRGPATADFSVTAGDSFHVHTPTPPIAVELKLDGKCPNGAAVQMGRKLVSQGTTSAIVLMKRGTNRYKVRCLDESGVPEKEAAAKGTIRVLRSSGIAKLPVSAPSSTVETDGRRYKVMYQNRLPNITVKWPSAPSGQKYVLHLESEGSEAERISTKRPEHRLKSGKLKEGTHQIQYEAIGNLSRTSKTTTVEISFDNAAPMASISEPKNRSFSPGATVKVVGVVAPGWKISYGGQPFEMDNKSRFSGAVTHNPKYNAIALRLYHPQRGVHYYLRRATGRAP